MIQSDEFYMKMAITIAKRGRGKTSPNPLVGAVIVNDSGIIAKGWHKALGDPHAEIEAIRHAKRSVKGATIYVNLEPCSHYGRTPPCAEALIKAGIKRVVVAMEDPNPKVSGNGIRMLKAAGIEVAVGVLEDAAKKLNRVFIKYITQKRPFVTMKCAMTLDGKIATEDGDSKWISSEKSRNVVHNLRYDTAAIMVGINTVISDDPSLTARPPGKVKKEITRIIVDRDGIIPLESRVLKNAKNVRVIVASTSKIKDEKERALINLGATVLKLDGVGGYVDLNALMDELYKMEIDSVILEGGGSLNAAMLENKLVDRVMMFVCPKIAGGKGAKTPVEGKGVKLMKDAPELKNIKFRRIENDILIEGDL